MDPQTKVWHKINENGKKGCCGMQCKLFTILSLKKFNILIMNLAKVVEMRTWHNSWDFWMTDIYNFSYFMFMREIKKKKSCILIQDFTDKSDLIFTHYICT